MALGPNQGAGVPAPYNSDGVLWDLYSYDVAVPLEQSFNGQLPGWNSGPLVAASTGLVLNVSGSKTTLSESSLTDITQSIDSNGNAKVTFPSGQTGVENRVFAYYLKQELYPEVQSQAHVQTAVNQSPSRLSSKMDLG